MRDHSTDKPARLRVGFVLAQHFTLTAFSSFVDALRLASDEGDRSRQIHCRWTVMSSNGRPVRASCGVEISGMSALVDARGFDYLVVVGGLLQPRPQVDEATLRYLRDAATAGVALIGVCTGSFILARAGLLKGRRACVSWFHREDFLEEFGDVTPITDRLYLIDRDRITCSGGAGVADLAAALIERHLGAETARKTLRVMLIDIPRTETTPQPMPSLARAARDERVRRAILIMEQNLSDPRSVARIAAQIGVSARQLERLFLAEMGVGPASAYRAMRLDYGRWLITQGARRVGDAASLAGFADSAHFTREFRKRWGEAPSDVAKLQAV
jgi:transcriptional regulator GlxA family with amidase domain